MAPASDTRDPVVDGTRTGERRIEGFERLLTLWVFLCMVGGVALGRVAPGFARTPSSETS